MSKEIKRDLVLKAIKKCLSDAHDHFQDAMDTLDEIGRGSVGPGMAPLIGGYMMDNPEKRYRSALIEVDAAEKALKPLTKRIQDGLVNGSHFTDPQALVMLKDLFEFDYNLLIRRLSDESGRESVWYRLRELSEKVREVFDLVADS